MEPDFTTANEIVLSDDTALCISIFGCFKFNENRSPSKVIGRENEREVFKLLKIWPSYFECDSFLRENGQKAP